MPYLGDYIGHLLSEVTNARVQGDLESVRIAEIYATHPLLRNMPVPHFRLPKVDLDVPIAIAGMEVTEDEETTNRVISNMRESFDRAVSFHARSARITLSDESKTKLKKELDKKSDELKRQGPKKQKEKQKTKSVRGEEEAGKPLSVTTITDEFIDVTIKALEPLVEGEKDGPERLQKMKNDLKKAAFMEFSKYLHENTRLNVSTTSKELKEVGQGVEPRNILVNIRLSITEEAFEWSVVESEGETQELLVPE